MKIFKYPLKLTDIQKITIPVNHQLLCLQMQKNIPTLWAEVEENSDTYRELVIVRYGTGCDIDSSDSKYIGTVQDSMGFVWHFYLKNWVLDEI